MSRRVPRTTAIASARAIIPSFNVIASICQLNYVDDWTTWEDAEGNLLKIRSNGKRISVAKAPVTQERTHDIFRKASPEAIKRHSYWAFALFGQPSSLLCLLGNDGVLRSCYYRDGVWVENIPPLLCGFHIIKSISARYMDTEAEVVENCNFLYDNDSVVLETWISEYPITDKKLKEKCNSAFGRR